MNQKVIVSIVVGITVLSNTAMVGASESSAVDLGKRLQYLAQRIAAQDKAILENEQKTTVNSHAEWLNNIEFSGLVEIEALNSSPKGAPDKSDVYVATVELGLSGQVNEWAAADIVFLYEDEGDHLGEIDVDSAAITIANPDANWYLTVGQYALSFGNFASNLISDPITLEAVETYDAAVELGFLLGVFSGSVYSYKGDQESEIHNYGFNLAVEFEKENMALNGGFGWVNDLSETDLVVDEASIMSNKAAAWTVFAQVDIASFTVIGEYIAASEALDAYSSIDKPSFFNFEGAVGFEALGRPATFAIATQGSSEASKYAGGIDDKRNLAAFSVELSEATNFAIEYANTKNYTGIKTNTITAQLAAEF